MESALLKLLGLTLAHLALRHLGHRATLLAVEGQDVIAACVGEQPEATAKVVAQATARFWAEVAKSSIPRHELKAHIECVSDLVRSSGGCCCARARPNQHAGNADSEACAIAHDIVAQASVLSEAPGAAGMDARATLESMFGALLSCGPELDVCIATAANAVVQFVANDIGRAEMLQGGPLVRLQQQLVIDTGISPALLEAIVSAQVRVGSTIEMTTQTLVERAVMALEVLTDLVHLSGRTGADEALEAEMLHVATLIREGSLGMASCALDTLSRRMESSSDFESRVVPDLTGTAFFPALLAARARLASLDGELREAARLYQRAVRYWPREDRIGRWQIKISQARQLVELGRLPGGDNSVLCEAAQVYAAAGGLISECDCPLGWAEASLELGLLLLELGNRESRPERYLAAALHFMPAIDVFTREKAMDGWARSQLGLAHALRGQAAQQGDVVIAREAVFAYRAALGILTEDGTPELWHHARSAFADTLVMIAEEAGDHASLKMAIDQLMPYLASPAAAIAEPARSIGDIAMGRAMVLLVESGSEPGSEANVDCGDDTIIASDAIKLLTTALERGQVRLNAPERVRAERALGRAQSLCFHQTGDENMRAEAIASKMRARDLYEHLDNPVAANDIASEIAALNDICLERLRGDCASQVAERKYVSDDVRQRKHVGACSSSEDTSDMLAQQIANSPHRATSAFPA